MNQIIVPEKNFKIVGLGEMPVVPTISNGWWIVPAHEYQKRIPTEAYEQFVALVNSGAKVKGLVVMDDFRKVQLEEVKRKKREKAIKNIGKVAVGVLSTTATIAGFLLLAPFYAMAYDPALVAILEDGRWVLLYAWYD